MALGWALIPADDVPLVTDRTGAWDVEPWDYPWVGFADGEIEGTDLNNLWLLVRGSPAELQMWGTPFWDGPPGSEKIAPVRQAVIEAFADLPESRIGDLAVKWQQTESPTSSLRSWKTADVAEAIREMKFLARQHQKLRHGWELLMIWWV